MVLNNLTPSTMMKVLEAATKAARSCRTQLRQLRADIVMVAFQQQPQNFGVLDLDN
jgi:hypothetical protein